MTHYIKASPVIRVIYTDEVTNIEILDGSVEIGGVTYTEGMGISLLNEDITRINLGSDAEGGFVNSHVEPDGSITITAEDMRISISSYIPEED